ncbi:MAG: iron-containing alcohol dehydrogenase [Cyclobacteriaceae bacterium]|nr:iron-containing alcohol dehydrogenase [Cyclobacteriaceae bacterium]
MQHYSFPTNILFGEGAVRELPAHLKSHQLNRPLVVTDPQVAQLSFFKELFNYLELKGLKPLLFSDIHGNPLKSDVQKGKESYQQGADSILGIGGGAAMDVSRAIALSINHHRDLFEYDELQGGTQYITEPIPHFITVPTTSGTGSEVGRAAIISEDRTKRKRILFHPTLIAKQVFADPSLTYELPAAITAATGMDALTHHMEAYIAKGFHPMCEGIALEGMRLIAKSLKKAVRQPDKQSRSDMMIASLMGAVAFQKGLGIVHALSHPLSTLLDMHHGLANAINLPYGLNFNYPDCKDQFQMMAQALGLKDGSDIKAALIDLNQALGLPSNLSECGVDPSQIEDLTDLALKDFCLPANPREATYEDIRSLYSENII